MMYQFLPGIKSFFKGIDLGESAHQMLIRFMLSIIVRQGRNSAMHASESLIDQPRHRAQPARWLGRVRWRALNLLESLVNRLMDQEISGRYFLVLDSTMVGHQGSCMENTYSTGNANRRPRKNRRYKNYKYSRKSCHCFMFGLLLTPQGTRIPFFKPYYTQEYAIAKNKRFKTQSELGTEIIRDLPLPFGVDMVVLGDTAFDAKNVRQACQDSGYHWIVPVNANRVFSGRRKARPRVSTRINSLSTEQLHRIRLSVSQGKYVAQQRLSEHRLSPKQKTRTFYVHSEERKVHSVGQVLLVFSSTRLKNNKPVRESTKILMTNNAKWSARQVVELYALGWQVELFFKELKSVLGMHHYKFQNFDAVEGWIEVVLITFVYLEWTRCRKLKDRRLKAEIRQRWQRQRCYGIRKALLTGIEIRKIQWIQKRIKTKTGIKTIERKLKTLLTKEYQCAA